MWAYNKETPVAPSGGILAPILQMERLHSYPLAGLQRQGSGLGIQALFPHSPLLLMINNESWVPALYPWSWENHVTFNLSFDFLGCKIDSTYVIPISLLMWTKWGVSHIKHIAQCLRHSMCLEKNRCSSFFSASVYWGRVMCWHRAWRWGCKGEPTGMIFAIMELTIQWGDRC